MYFSFSDELKQVHGLSSFRCGHGIKEGGGVENFSARFGNDIEKTLAEGSNLFSYLKKL